MDAEYKLTYFPVKALAEPIRFLLSYGKMKFEDVRVPKDTWPDIKHNMPFGQVPILEDMPFGQVPILEVNGKLAHQSVAISRYLAKQTDLVGADDWENLEIDAMVDTITDLRSKIAAFNIEKDESQKDDLKKTLEEETLPYYLQRMDSAAADSGHLILGKMTWADLYFVSLLDYCNGIMQMDIIKDYPNLITVRENVLSVPAIMEWIEKRPDSDY